MKKTIVLFGMMALLAAASSAGAAEITTADGVLSIITPGDEWKEMADANEWFAVSDGKNTITIDHLSNGEILPPVDVAGIDYGAVCQAFVSTRNEVFIVEGLAASQEDLETVMKTIGTIKVLKYDTKTAVQKNEQPAQSNQSGIRQIDATYYVTTDVLNVRSGCSTDEPAIGAVYYGEPVLVTGAVTNNGTDSGWYQIQYKGMTGYASSSFLSPTAPAAGTAGNSQAETGSMEQCQYCGQWFVLGDEYRNHLLGHSMSNLYDGKVQCEYCGEWFDEGNDYRNHVFAAHTTTDQYAGKVQCEYCGEWFDEGNDYRNHVFAAHGGQ